MQPSATLIDNNIELKLTDGQWITEQTCQDCQYGFWTGEDNVFIQLQYLVPAPFQC